MSTAGILLAAGGGRRFGGPKALVTHRGELLVERGARVLAAGGCDPVLVVIGAAASDVRAAADLAPGVVVVVNEGWEEGIGSSLRAGLTALEAIGEHDAAVVALADQPEVSPAAVERLVAAQRGGATAAVATFAGEPRNPVLLTRGLWPAVAAQAVGDVGARGYLRDHPELVTEVACDDVASDLDIDTPEDLAALGRQAEEGAPCN